MSRPDRRSSASSLRAIKLAHTAVWAFFAAAVVAIPIFAATRQIGLAGILIAVVFLEVLVLVVNRWRCPLTDIAAQYTDDRRDNFDIYLPEWLARHNKVIFGLLYLFGIVVTIAEWTQS